MFPWGGIYCCLSAAALYLLGRTIGRDAHALKSVARVNQLKDLAALIDAAASKVLPLVVVVSGRVGSDTPIKCGCSGLRGVIFEDTAEHYFLKRDYDACSWVKDSKLTLCMSKEVPWYLDDGTGLVYVQGSRGATGMELTIGSELFVKSPSQSLVRRILDCLQGLKMLGVKHTERVLPTGTSLTVVGEAIRDDAGAVRVQRPLKGPFYVSPKPIDQLIANLSKWDGWFMYGSIGLMVFGVCLVAKHELGPILERRRRLKLQKQILKAASERFGQNSDAVKDDRDALTPDLCVVCMEREYNIVFVPCGHMCCCTACSSQLSVCPLCRRILQRVVRTFRH